jgi:hypothetical protein
MGPSQHLPRCVVYVVRRRQGLASGHRAKIVESLSRFNSNGHSEASYDVEDPLAGACEVTRARRVVHVLLRVA